MTTVVQFSSDRTKRSKPQGPAEPGRRGPAAIIIFPGIRYERQMAGQPVRPASPSPGRVRKQ